MVSDLVTFLKKMTRNNTVHCILWFVKIPILTLLTQWLTNFWLSDSLFLTWVQKSELRLLSCLKSPFWFKTKNFDKCLTSDSDRTSKWRGHTFFFLQLFFKKISLTFTLKNNHLFLHTIPFFKIVLWNSLFIPRWYKIGIFFLLRCIFYQISPSFQCSFSHDLYIDCTRECWIFFLLDWESKLSITQEHRVCNQTE